MLAEYQISVLRHDLRTLAHIEYEEVENELLDHYATLTEQAMANGQTFGQASYEAWVALGEGVGLLQIQEDFVKNVRKQVSDRHKEIVKSYFRWPTIVTTLLICGLLYLLSTVLSPGVLYLIICALFISPGLILLYAVLRRENRHTDSRKLVWQYMNENANLPIFSIHFAKLVDYFVGNKNKPVFFFQEYPAFSAGLACILLIYALTFLQLYQERFYYKIAR
ncbi:hypothetical protein GCM10027347_05840 [Larkinella harenae]